MYSVRCFIYDIYTKINTWENGKIPTFCGYKVNISYKVSDMILKFFLYSFMVTDLIFFLNIIFCLHPNLYMCVCYILDFGENVHENAFVTICHCGNTPCEGARLLIFGAEERTKFCSNGELLISLLAWPGWPLPQRLLKEVEFLKTQVYWLSSLVGQNFRLRFAKLTRY